MSKLGGISSFNLIILRIIGPLSQDTELILSYRSHGRKDVSSI